MKWWVGVLLLDRVSVVVVVVVIVDVGRRTMAEGATKAVVALGKSAKTRHENENFMILVVDCPFTNNNKIMMLCTYLVKMQVRRRMKTGHVTKERSRSKNVKRL